MYERFINVSFGDFLILKKSFITNIFQQIKTPPKKLLGKSTEVRIVFSPVLLTVTFVFNRNIFCS